jgi:integrase/recombinase XerC
MMLNEIDQYREYLSRLPVSPHTRRNYLGRVKLYLGWLSGSPDCEKALSEPIERDFAVHDYKVSLLQLGRSSYTVNAVLSALDNFYLYKGIGAAKVRRQDLPVQAPRALEAEEQRRLLKVIAQSHSARNKAIALIMLHCGLRISEVRQLNFSDIALTARKHELVVRCGKNDKRRVVPINTDLAVSMREYFSSVGRPDPETQLFTSQKGNRLSVGAIDQIVRRFGRDAGVEFSSHSLRHTCITKLVRAGVDIVTVAEIAGHSRLETSRRYSMPTEAVKAAAMERLNYGSTQA